MLTINRISDLTGIDRRTIQKRLGGIKPEKVVGTFRYYPDEALRLVNSAVRYPSTELEQRKKEGDARKAIAAAVRMERQNLVALGRLVEIGEVERFVSALIFQTRNKLMTLPRRVAPHLVGLDAGNVAQIIEIHLREILDEMKNEPLPEQLRKSAVIGLAGVVEAVAIPTEGENNGLGGTVLSS
jgi:hypothetical protein